MPKNHPLIVPYEIEVGQYLAGHDWRCERLLGRGGMGSVYQMVRGELAFQAAVKLLHRNLASQPQFVQLFLEEARILKQVGDHPNLPRILDYAKLPDGTPFIVMELLDGNTLGRIIRSEPGKRFDRDVAFKIIDQVLAGVFELHSQGIIHRDLKPDNIFLERRAKAGPGAAVKILDCGLAFKDSSRHEGALQGTPRYMSPEQVRCEPVSPQTDLYAAALILCEMLLGHLPFDVKRDGVKEWLDAHQWMDPTPLSKYFDWISPKANSLVLSALSKNPEKRPRSALDFQNGLYLEAKRLRDGLPAETYADEGDANITTPTPMDLSDITSPDGISRTEPIEPPPPRTARKETLRMDTAPTHPVAGNVWQPAAPVDPGLTGAQPSFAAVSPAPAPAALNRTPDPRMGPSPLASSVPAPMPQPNAPAGGMVSVAASFAAPPSYMDPRVSAVRTSTAGTAQSVRRDPQDEPSVEMRRSIRRKVIVRSTLLVSGLALCSTMVVGVVRVVSRSASPATAPTASIASAPTVPLPPTAATATLPVSAPSPSAPAPTVAPPPASVPPPSAAAATPTPAASAVTPPPARSQPVVRTAAPTTPTRPKSNDGYQELWR